MIFFFFKFEKKNKGLGFLGVRNGFELGRPKRDQRVRVRIRVVRVDCVCVSSTEPE